MCGKIKTNVVKPLHILVQNIALNTEIKILKLKKPSNYSEKLN
jgi:hypothetical protein